MKCVKLRIVIDIYRDLLRRRTGMDYEEEIVIVSDPEVCGGKPVVRGTRVPVEIIVKMSRRGYTPEQIHEEYPSVPVEAIEVIRRSLMRRNAVLVEIKV